MHALVTGGAGFIGSNVVELLLRDGHEVTILDDLSSGYLENVQIFPEARFIRGSVCDHHAVTAAVEGAETVFHLAASVGNKRSIDNPLEDSRVNVIGTLNVLEAARRYDVEKVVFSSSAGIFGELRQLPIAEDHPVEPDTPYGAGKLAAEKHCLAYAKLYDLDAVSLRYFNVYGVRQRYDEYGNVIPIFVQRLLDGRTLHIYGDGEQTRDFVNVRDVARANVQAAEARGLSGAFNLGSGKSITINELVKVLAEASGREIRPEYAKPRPGDVRHSRADVRAAQNAFGFAPSVGVREGLAEYWTWASQEWRR